MGENFLLHGRNMTASVSKDRATNVFAPRIQAEMEMKARRQRL